MGISSGMARSGASFAGPITRTCSPPRKRREGLAVLPSTNTCPCSMSCCRRARLTSGILAARNWSRRVPACSTRTEKLSGDGPVKKKGSVLQPRRARARALADDQRLTTNDRRLKPGELAARHPGLSAWDGDGLVHAALEPPDHATQNHQPNRDQLCPAHQPAKDRTAAGIATEEFQEEARHSIDNQVRAEHLAIELLALQHPHEQEEVCQLHREFKELGRLKRLVERSSDQIMRHRIGERDAPPAVRGLTKAASRGKTSHPSDRVSDGKPRRKSVAGRQRRHVLAPDIPYCGDQRRDQAAGEYASSLQRAQTEDVGPARIGVPVV